MSWLSFYIVYHTGDRDRLLVELVRPLVRSLLWEGKIESAFFIRYPNGGPHIRLRFRPVSGCAEEVRESVRRCVETFLRDHPSPAAIPEEQIRRLSRAAGSSGAGEPDVVFPDNTLLEVPFQPETGRYGGPRLLPRSLDFFALSSVWALRLLARRPTITEGEWMTAVLRLQARHVLGFARDLDEIATLARIPQSATGEQAELLKARADQAYAQSGRRFGLLLRKEIDRLAAGDVAPMDERETARRLAHALAAEEDERRRSVFLGQIHMTSNRLGLRNVEEIYAARFLWRALEQIREEDPGAWDHLGTLLVSRASRPPGPDRPLKELLLDRL